MARITKDTKVGEEFAGKPKILSWARIWAFSGGPFSNQGWPKKNVHTDLEFARACGLPTVGVSATQYMGHMAELMIDLFGLDWLRHGTFDVKFVDLVDAGDTLVPKATVESKEARGSATKFNMNVRSENQRGRDVLVGSATGIVGAIDYCEIRPDAPLPALPGLESLKKEREWAPLEYLATSELNEQYLFSEEAFDRWYIEATEFGPAVVHPGFLLNWSNTTRSPSYNIGPGEGGLHARDETFFYNPARVGKKIKVVWNSLGSYEKRGRPWSVTEAVISDEDGVVILKRRSHGTVASQQYKKEYKR